MTGARGSRSPRTAWQAGSASTSVVPRGRGTSRADDRSPGRVPCACRDVGRNIATNSRWRSPCARVPPPVPSASSGPHRRGGPHCFRAPSTCGSGPSGRTDGPTPAATHEEQPRPPSCGTNDLNFGWGAEGVVSPVGQGTEDDSNRAGSVIVRQAGPRSSTSRPTPQRPAERHRRDRPGQRPSAVGRGADSTRLGIVRLPTPQSTRRWSTIHHAACWRGTSAGGVSAGDPLGPGFRWRCGRRRPRRLRR